MIEEWKRYLDFDYEVSNLSRIRNAKTLRVLKPHLHHSNYYTIAFKRKGHKPKYLSRARIVAMCWIPNPENKKEINHKNGVTTDDSIPNLEWVTPSENILHYFYVLDKGCKRKVMKMDMDGTDICEYESITKAVKSLRNPKATSGNIVMVCQNKHHYAYGFKWRYIGDRPERTYQR